MVVSKEISGNAAIYHLNGEMDLYTSQSVREQIKEALTDGFKRIILNCKGLEYIDSSGIGVLISLFTTLRKKGGTMCLCSLTKPVESVISFTKLNGFLDITKTLEEAKGSVRIQVDEKIEAVLPGQRIGIIQDDNHILMNSDGMYSKEFNLDLRRVRRLSQLILQKAPPEIKEINLLEQQISEIIKNGVRHGNKNDPNKKIKIWFSFSKTHAHIILQDEGNGFKNIQHWNDFYRRKMKAYDERDFETLINYLSYRTSDSKDEDGGNALFAAVEFWNKGVVISQKGNTIAVKREYS
ncbi:STAS domain-containing protein [Oceanispirochaeta crateris]|uniref:Anti-sigma factor antagonist n=1 Tax=Oceanispirochaeta crateris TaxID=2518645 RepID=A0A5C1QQ26_9SPIO|nr:anti-sigma factor antagonist [Oceanispirochaeta crateris]QEN08714.1 STAS domain-containing protein [Oceanispirochaeta crateris]